MKVDGCYASVLDNCKGVLSREHIITSSLIGDKMQVNLSSKEASINKGDFIVRNLCVGHNNSFRKVESHIRQLKTFLHESSLFWTKIRQINMSSLHELKLPLKFKIKGDYLEKWLVKTAVNYCYFLNDNKVPNLNFKYISNRLFQSDLFKFEFPYGLSLLHPKMQLTNQFPGQIYFEVIKDENNEIGGVIINLEGYLFFVLFPSENSSTITRTGVTYLNEHFQFSDQSFVWHGGGYKEQQLTLDEQLVTRTEISIKW